MDDGRRKLLRQMLLGVAPVLMIAAGAYAYLSGGRYVTSENAYVRAQIIEVSAEIDGRAVEVAVADNQRVAAGALLLRIDPRPFEIALAAAEAELAEVRLRIEGMRARVKSSESELAAAEERIRYLRLEQKRQSRLEKKGIASSARSQEADHELAMAEREAVASAERRLMALAELGGSASGESERHPLFMAARAKRDAAALDLQRTVVRAPAAGTLASVRLQAGEHIEAGKAVLALVASESPWVEANLKEVQLTAIRVGQPAEIVVDAYPDVRFRARVESIAPATGAEFSLLPAQNATGNWVKVVQRVPVRLALEPLANAPELRAGMTATVSIDTGETGAGDAAAAPAKP